MGVPVLTIDFAAMVATVEQEGTAFSTTFLFDEADMGLFAAMVRKAHMESPLQGKSPYRLIVLFDRFETLTVSTEFVLEVFGYLMRSVLIYTTHSAIEFRDFPEGSLGNLKEAIMIIQERLNARSKKEKLLDCIAYRTLGSFFTQQY